MRFALAPALLLCFARSQDQSQSPGQSQSKLHASTCEQARAAYRTGRLTEALPAFEACAQIDSDPELLFMQAHILYDLNRLSEAQTIALLYLQQRPTSSQAMFLLGRALEKAKDARKSLEWFTKAAALARPGAEDLRFVALDYVLLDDYPDAVHWLERAVALDANNAETWYDLGRAYMMRGNAAGAETALTTSLRLRPRSVKAENNLGVNYEAENRDADAVAAYKRAIEWQRDEPARSEQPMLNLGTLLITMQRAEEAVPLLEQAEVLAPADAKVHEQLARAYEGTGALVKAVPQMERAVRIDPGSARLHYQLGLLYRRQGNAEKARTELALSAKLYGTHSTSPDK